VTDAEEDGSAFLEVLGGFGKHTNLERRAKAERLAAMKPGDGRRRKKEPRVQFNVRISEVDAALARSLIAELSTRDGRDWSQGELVSAGFKALARRKPAPDGAAT
jgi:hypothetical protein